jgi:hypothetical protein
MLIREVSKGLALGLASVLLVSGLALLVAQPASAVPERPAAGKCVQTAGFGYLTSKKAMRCKRAGKLMRKYIKAYLASNDPDFQPAVPGFKCTRKLIIETADSSGSIKVRCQHKKVQKRNFRFVVGP